MEILRLPSLVCQLQGGTVLGRSFQPYESHIPYLLQLKVRCLLSAAVHYMLSATCCMLLDVCYLPSSALDSTVLFDSCSFHLFGFLSWQIVQICLSGQSANTYYV